MKVYILLSAGLSKDDQFENVGAFYSKEKAIKYAKENGCPQYIVQEWKIDVKCKCEESKKPLEDRDWVKTKEPRKSNNVYNLILPGRVFCNSCNSCWESKADYVFKVKWTKPMQDAIDSGKIKI